MKKYFTHALLVVSLLASSFSVSFAQTLQDDVVDEIDCAPLTYNLSLGARDSRTKGQVTILQTFLSQAGYLESDPTGYFGQATKKAVRSFQSGNGISALGGVGAYTRAKIKEVSCTSVKNQEQERYKEVNPKNIDPSTTLLPNVSITAFPSSVEYGKTSTVSWTSTNSTSCSYAEGAMDVVKGNSFGVSGSFSLAPTTSKEYSITCYGKGGYTTRYVSVNVEQPSQSSYVTLVAFSNKDPNPTTGATTIVWRTSKAAATLSNGAIPISLDVSCNPEAISFTTNKGNAPDCIKGGVWNWSNVSEGEITVSPVGNTRPLTVPFTLTIQDPSGEYSKRQTQTLSITFPATKALVLSSNPVPTVEFLSVPTLKLQYDSANKESQLIGQVKVKVTAGSVPIPLHPSSVGSVLQFNFNNNAWNTGSNGMRFDAVSSLGGATTIPANTSVTFDVTITAKTGELFAGTYALKLSGLYYADSNGSSQTVQYTSFKNASGSNSVTIIGETSPYITGVTIQENGVANIQGSRFDPSNNQVTINGITKQVTASANGQVIVFNPKDFNISSSGNYLVQVSANGQASNRLGISINVPIITTATNVVPTVEFLSVPTLKLQYDSANKESQLIGQAVVKVTTGASSLRLPTDSIGNPVLYMYNLVKSGGDSFVNLNSAKFVTTSSSNSSSTIPPNTSVTFTTTYTAKPIDMHAGSYKITPTDLYYVDQSGNGQTLSKASFRNAANSNQVNVIGESVYQQIPQGNEGGYNDGAGGGGEVGGGGASLIIKSTLSHVNSVIEKGKAIVLTLSGATQVSALSCVDIKSNLHRGYETASVSKLQNFLVEKGLLGEKATGFFGDLTIEAVKAYQRSIGLPETGMVYDFTRNAIMVETCQ